MIEFPVLIIGCPRSGTSLLYNILSEIPELWSLGYESKAIIEHYHHPSAKGWVSGVLNAEDITEESRFFMLSEFERQAAPGVFWQRVNEIRSWMRKFVVWQAIKNRGKVEKMGSGISSLLPQQGLNTIRKFVSWRNSLFPRPSQSIRLLEKTPENCLRLPFLLELFPDARVIYLIRDGRTNVNSLMEGWRQPHLFPGYKVPGGVEIPGDIRGRWAFALIPGWRELRDRSLEEVCAWQWVKCNQAVLEHFEQSQGQVPHIIVRYEDLINNPAKVLSLVGEFVQVPYNDVLSKYAESLPLINAISSPDPEKWRRQNGDSIKRVLPVMLPMLERLNYH